MEISIAMEMIGCVQRIYPIKESGPERKSCSKPKDKKWYSSSFAYQDRHINFPSVLP